MSPLLALFGHGAMSDLSPLSGVKRKLDFGAVRAAFDLGCVKTCTSQECAELFSLSSSLSNGRKHFWFSNLRNREGVSTRSLNVGVFTRPRPISDNRWLNAGGCSARTRHPFGRATIRYDEVFHRQFCGGRPPLAVDSLVRREARLPHLRIDVEGLRI